LSLTSLNLLAGWAVKGRLILCIVCTAGAVKNPAVALGNVVGIVTMGGGVEGSDWFLQDICLETHCILEEEKMNAAGRKREGHYVQ